MKLKHLQVLLLPVMLLFVGCEDDGPDIDTESSTPVRVEEVVRKNIKEYVFATGTVSAISESALKATQSGYYQLQTNPRTQRPYAMGDEIKTGDIIIRLINLEFENQVAFDSKKLNFEISEREFEKQQSIYDKGGITLRELTDAERAFIDSRYSFRNASLQLAQLTATALFDGILTDLPFFSEGQLVETGSLLAQVMDYSRLVAEVTLPGKEMERVGRGQEAQVTNYGKAGDTAVGKVTQVSPTLDPDTRMFKLTLEVANRELILRPGMFVKADIIVDEKDSAVVIPKDIILDRRDGKVVFVVDKGIAGQRTLETGLSNRAEVEVLSGVTEGERLVVEGFETLRHRSKVKLSK